jgi:biopolymer transport protein TolR
MLVLLVIFMVTAPFLNQGIDVDLPKAQADQINTSNRETEILSLSVKKDGTCYLSSGLEKTQIVSCQSLEPHFTDVKEYLSKRPQPPVLVRADRELKYERVIKAMSILQEAGAKKIGLSTATPDEKSVQH